MNGTLEIKDNVLKYKNSPENKLAYYKTKSFKININDIKIIGIYHTMIFDNEVDFLIFVDKEGNKEFVCITFDLTTDSFSELRKHFNLDIDLSLTNEKTMTIVIVIFCILKF